MYFLESSLIYIVSKFAKKRTLFALAGTIALLSWIAIFAKADTDELKLYFFDVGQGDAIFLEFPDGKQILIDGGPSDKVVERLNSVMPFWDRSIDIMIATHADADHVTGLVPVFAHYDIDMVVWNGVDADTKVFERWKEAALNEDAEIVEAKWGTRINLSPISFMEILYPYDGVEETAKLKQNDLSVVFRLMYGEDSFLFTGDMERQVEYIISSKDIAIESEVLKIPHHGSKTSSSELFLESVNPKIAVISLGRNNSYGHPHESVLQRLEKYDIEVRRTDLEGNILLRSNGNSF